MTVPTRNCGVQTTLQLSLTVHPRCCQRRSIAAEPVVGSTRYPDSSNDGRSVAPWWTSRQFSGSSTATGSCPDIRDDLPPDGPISIATIREQASQDSGTHRAADQTAASSRTGVVNAGIRPAVHRPSVLSFRISALVTWDTIATSTSRFVLPTSMVGSYAPKSDTSLTLSPASRPRRSPAGARG